MSILGAASMAIAIFIGFVAFVLWLSFYLGRRSQSASNYFAAGGNIHWSVNGIAFAGDYLSAASFLGICGMIATAGYDGFLYSIGYLAGWIVALFVVAEPMKRLGKYTFTDALDSKFNSKGIQLMAALSTLIVSVCYLIPQMVGAGVLVTPLLGLPHAVGVIMVGAIVIFIVATAGMASTTYVQFLKGALLILFSTILVICLCHRGLTTEPDQGGDVPFYKYATITAKEVDGKLQLQGEAAEKYSILGLRKVKLDKAGKHTKTFVKLSSLVPMSKADNIWTVKVKDKTLQFPEISESLEAMLRTGGNEKLVVGDQQFTVVNMGGRKLLSLDEGHMEIINGVKFFEEKGNLFVILTSWWDEVPAEEEGSFELKETQWVTNMPDGGIWNNGMPASSENQLMQVGNLVAIEGKTGPDAKTGSLGMFSFLSKLSSKDTKIRLWKSAKFKDQQDNVTVYYPKVATGNNVVRPGMKFKISGTWLEKMDFTSLMLALFFGTAALPHILIRYYTVPSPACARKSTIVAIAAIGFFYVLTLFMGLGAMASGVVNPLSNNMSAPLLAKSFGMFLFAIISAIAFATVLGTVSGLIVAASGAVAHDLMDRFGGLSMTDKQKVMAGKLAAFTVGLVAIILGIVFQGMNVSFLVGWAFAVAASANLPAILMLLFWKGTTAKGIIASILVGILVAVGMILLSPAMFERYGLARTAAPIPFDNPGIVSIPLSFITLVVVSLMTKKQADETVAA